VSFLDNHDQPQRIRHPATPEAQVRLALRLLFTLQGIPCLYYGTEQGLGGTVDEDGNPDLSSNESVREALWGRPGAFGTGGEAFRHVQALARLRREEPLLCFGRLYFREVSGNGADFGHSSGAGGWWPSPASSATARWWWWRTPGRTASTARCWWTATSTRRAAADAHRLQQSRDHRRARHPLPARRALLADGGLGGPGAGGDAGGGAGPGIEVQVLVPA
jgi:hypothetical protein